MTTRGTTTSDEASTYDERADGPARGERTAGRWERAASAAVGGYLLLGGLRRRSLGGVARTIAGGALLYRGLTGRGQLPGAIERRGRAMFEGRREGDTVTTVERSITVDAPPEELAAYWREPDHLDRVLGPAFELVGTGEDSLRWSVDVPLGRTLSWESELVVDEPGEAIRWESLEGSTVRNDWSVQFHPAPGGRGTEVALELRIDPPGGAVGTAVMGRLGIVPEMLAGTALRRFKSLAETGEIPTLERNPSARGQGDLV